MNEQGSVYNDSGRVSLARKDSDSRIDDRVILPSENSEFEGVITKEDSGESSNEPLRKLGDIRQSSSAHPKKRKLKDKPMAGSDTKAQRASSEGSNETASKYSDESVAKKKVKAEPLEENITEKNVSKADAEKEGKEGVENSAEKDQNAADSTIGDDTALYYTDNIAAACAATNDELTSSLQEDNEGPGAPQDGNAASRKSKSSSRGRKGGSKKNSSDVAEANEQNTSDVPSSLLLQKLQQENLDLVRENARLKQRVDRLSNLLEMAIGPSSSGLDTSGSASGSTIGAVHQGLGINSFLPQSSSASLLQTALAGGLGGGLAGGLNSDHSLLGSALNSSDVASLLARRYQQQHQDQERLAAMAAVGLGGDSTTGSSRFLGPAAASLLGSSGQQHSLLAQLLGGVGGAGLAPSSPLPTVPSTRASSELQRYLAESRVHGRRSSATAATNNSVTSPRAGLLPTLTTTDPSVATGVSATHPLLRRRIAGSASALASALLHGRRGGSTSDEKEQESPIT